MLSIVFSLGFFFFSVRPNPLRVETREVKERTVTVCWTHVFDGGRPITSYSIDLKNKQGKQAQEMQPNYLNLNLNIRQLITYCNKLQSMQCGFYLCIPVAQHPGILQ